MSPLFLLCAGFGIVRCGSRVWLFILSLTHYSLFQGAMTNFGV